MMAYAYGDKYGVVHIVEKMSTALKSRGKGQVVETNYPHEHGYPVKRGESIFIYPWEDKACIGGNTAGKGRPYDLNDDFALKELVEKIKGDAE